MAMSLTHSTPVYCLKFDQTIRKKRRPPECECSSWMTANPLFIISSSFLKRSLLCSRDGRNEKLTHGSDHLFLLLLLKGRRARGSCHLSTNLTIYSQFRYHHFPAKIHALCLKAESQPSSTYKDLRNQSKLHSLLGLATSLYPVYVTGGALLAVARPSTFGWFVRSSPASYSITLGTIMLCMGLTLSIRDLSDIIVKHPLAVAFGFAAQYGIMPLVGAAISKLLKLPPILAAGLILMASCPGGTASNVVTLIAKGDVPLSVIMTVCSTLAAVFATPVLTSLLAGAYVPVDAWGLAVTTLQVVVAPVLLGACMHSACPGVVSVIKPFSPLAAVLLSSLQASSVFSANVSLLGVPGQATLLSNFSNSEVSSLAIVPSFPVTTIQSKSFSSQLWTVVVAVFLVHAIGFLLGFLASKFAGFNESQSRAISIEVGMQNSSLGVVLASTHFGSALACVPPAISAILMNIMGSGLAVFWGHFGINSNVIEEGA